MCKPYRFIEITKQLIRIIEEVGSESIKVLFYSANICVKESPVSAIQTLGNLIAHVHLTDNDCRTRGKMSVGMGSVDFAAVTQALKSTKFKGVSVIELGYPNEDPDESLAISKERLEAVRWSR